MIWRRLLVRSDHTIADLHHILQIALGWTDTHLHQFRIHGKTYGIAPLGGIGFRDNSHQVCLVALGLRLRECFSYDYDFGDYWQHQLRVEAIQSPEPNQCYPVCIAGTRACPPADCGGIWGYAGVLYAIQEPQHPEHAEMWEWVGGEFDSEAFDRDEVNRELQRLKSPEVGLSQR